MKSLKEVREKLIMGVTGARSALYFLESLPLPFIDALIAKGSFSVETPPAAMREKIVGEMRKLLEKDARGITEGYYPASVLIPENPLAHPKRVFDVFVDSVALTLRKKGKNHRSFSKEAQTFFQDVPDYYRRNFHFQKDGYLSERSARLYDQQVEMLFRGLADPMRRLIIPPLKRHFHMSQGEDLHLLEIGCGTGSSTRFVAQAFPRAKITALDLSYPYLKVAQERLRDEPRIDFLQGDGASLPFKDASFDAVFSVFLFHELPEKERRRMLSESVRVLKPRGMVALVDSIQKHDSVDLAWALDLFPREFHEPFYKNYSETPIEPMVENATQRKAESEIGFYSKAVSSPYQISL